MTDDGPRSIWPENEDGPRFGCVLSLYTSETSLDDVLSGDGRYEGVHVRITWTPLCSALHPGRRC